MRLHGRWKSSAGPDAIRRQSFALGVLPGLCVGSLQQAPHGTTQELRRLVVFRELECVINVWAEAGLADGPMSYDLLLARLSSIVRRLILLRHRTKF